MFTLKDIENSIHNVCTGSHESFRRQDSLCLKMAESAFSIAIEVLFLLHSIWMDIVIRMLFEHTLQGYSKVMEYIVPY